MCHVSIPVAADEADGWFVDRLSCVSPRLASSHLTSPRCFDAEERE